jgi:hypothetical protein
VAESEPRRTTRTRRTAAATSTRRASSARGRRPRDDGPVETDRTRETRESAGDTHAETASVCPVAFCPICTAVSVVNRASPDVVQHLLVAGQQFLLALQAVVDARAADFRTHEAKDEGAPRIERIDIG